MKDDIRSYQDIKHVVDTFYHKAIADPDIGYFFGDVMDMDLQDHLPVIYSFWDSVLFGTATYRGNVMLKHIDLNRRSKMTSTHFDIWLTLWERTVLLNYEGPKAQEAIEKAKNMKTLMLFKIEQSQAPGFIQ